MQKMTSFYLQNYPFESIFQKVYLEILILFKVLANTTRGPVYLELFRPFALEVLELPPPLKQECSEIFQSRSAISKLQSFLKSYNYSRN